MAVSLKIQYNYYVNEITFSGFSWLFCKYKKREGSKAFPPTVIFSI